MPASVPIPATMRALVVAAPGAPLQVTEVPVPRPGPGEVLVKIAASPANPSDLATLAGDYGNGWPFPLTPGLEGSGTVVASGGGLLGRSLLGARVACVAGARGLWAEYAVTGAARCLKLGPDAALGPAAMSFVNPLTAVALVEIARRGGHRWAVSTAAGGALGRMIRRHAAERGVGIIDVVRRAAQAEALRAEGPGPVLATEDPGFDAALAEACARHGCRLGFDAVGGETTYRLAQALRPGGEIHVYGALAGAPVTLNPGTMIFRGLTVRGFWLSHWMTRRSFPAQVLTARRVQGALRGGFAETRVARVVDLDAAPAAIAGYARAMSAGKVLIAPGGEDLGLKA